VRCAKGAGFRRIAHDLNSSGCLAPRPSKTGPRGWSPTTVRDVLHRELYRGVLLHGRTQKRDAWGQKRTQRRPESEWLRVEMPDLRIVSDEQWHAAHDRLRGSRETYLRSTADQVWGKPSNGVDSKYLLAGMAVCASCGGALTARSRSHGRHREFSYQCLTNVQRGRTVCNNDLVVPLKDTEAAVLATVEQDVLRPEVVNAALKEALARLQPEPGQSKTEQGRLEKALSTLDVELSRLTEALVSGGPLPSIVAAIRQREEQRGILQADLVGLKQLQEVQTLDVRRIERDLRAKITDWRGLLSRNVTEARQVLRALMPTRLTFTAKKEGGERLYRFDGMAVLDRLLSGVVLPEAMMAPTGFVR
jgi:site-specific DNA recombinase